MYRRRHRWCAMLVSTWIVCGLTPEKLLPIMRLGRSSDLLWINETRFRMHSIEHWCACSFVAEPVNGVNCKCVRVSILYRNRSAFNLFATYAAAKCKVINGVMEGIPVVEVYYSPRLRRDDLQNVLELVSKCLQRTGLLIGDQKTRNRQWDDTSNAQSITLQQWAT